MNLEVRKVFWQGTQREEKHIYVSLRKTAMNLFLTHSLANYIMRIVT